MKYVLLPIRQSLFCLFFLFMFCFLNAQHMSMEHNSKTKKNVYLFMMDSMMIRMEEAPKYDAIDIDFVQQMIAHHQGAINMANHEIKYGKDFFTIQLAKSILIEQTNEINQMKIWLKELLADLPEQSPDFQKNFDESMDVMMQNMPANELLHNIDNAFSMVMIPHHQAAIDMAKTVIKFSKNQQLISFSKSLISSEQIEIDQMLSFLKR